MKVAVAGGTGVLGKLLVAELAARGELPEGAAHRRVDLSSGAGLAEALAGVEVVVDAANTAPNQGKALVAMTQRLLDVAAEAGVRHFLEISIVGCDRVPMPYYKAKVEQEEATAASEVPWSLLRATQFHDLLGWAFDSAARWHLLPTGNARLQPVDVRIVARRLAEAAHAEPAGRLPDIAG